MVKPSVIRDIHLADEGMQRIRWVEKFMPALNTLSKTCFNPDTFKGKTIVMSIHLEAKTAYLALTLKKPGLTSLPPGATLCLPRIPSRRPWSVRESPYMRPTDVRIRSIWTISIWHWIISRISSLMTAGPGTSSPYYKEGCPGKSDWRFRRNHYRCIPPASAGQ